MQTIGERISELEEGHWLLISATTFEHIMSGTVRVGVFPDGRIKIIYMDGMEEMAPASQAVLDMDAEGDGLSLFGIVACVQEQRESDVPAPLLSDGRRAWEATA